jgi:outer membrane lipoprotein-sorting protein
MFRRQFLMLGLIAALVPAVPALAQTRTLTPDEQQLVNEINAHNGAIRTMVGRFLQIDTNGGRSEGTFFLERPNKIAFRYAPPSREEIVSRGTGFYVVDRREETYYAYPQDSIPLRQFLGSEINILSGNVVDVSTTDGYLSVTLQDQTIAGTVQVSLVFDTQTKDLAQWTLVEPNGNQLTFSLYDVQQGVEIPSHFFTFPSTFKGRDPARN